MTIWKPIASHPHYQVSDDGRVRRDARELRGVPHPRTGHYSLWLYQDGIPTRREIHQLVAEAFIGPRPEGLETCHSDGNSSNNYASNLRYGTRAENAQDMVSHGGHRNARKTHCIHGHEFTESNTRINRRGGRECRACARDYQRKKRASL